MAGTLKHAKTSGKAAPTDTTKVGGPDWDADHNFAGGALGSLLYRDTGATDGANWLADVATGSVLVSGGVGAAPAWSATPTLADLTLTGQGKGKDGTASSPAWTFSTDATTGIWKSNTSAVGISSGGAPVAQFVNAGMSLASGQYLGWHSTSSFSSGSDDTILARDAANTLALRNSTNAQIFRVYNTFTDSSNYERAYIRWVVSQLQIGTEGSGTGVGRSMLLSTSGSNPITFATNATDRWIIQGAGHIVANADNTYDIGASGATRPRTVYIGTSLVLPGGTLLTTSAALTNGAAAATGTLTNAPTAGNPTKWIPINDNGTVRYIPCW